MIDPGKRFDVARKLAHEFGGVLDSDTIDVTEGPIALVERSAYANGEIYITMHKDIAAAAIYHDSQEFPEDWSIRACVNVDTGERYFPIPKTTFELYPDQEVN